MTYYISNGASSAVDSKEFETVEAALDFARAPAWVGAGPTEITMISEKSYKHRGVIYNIIEGSNPRLARATAQAVRPVHAAEARVAQIRAAYAHSAHRGSATLTRMMDDESSDL